MMGELVLIKSIRTHLLVLVLMCAALLLSSGVGLDKAAYAAGSSCGSWRLVTSPNVTSDNELNAVAAISSQDVWAVGQAHNGKITRTLTELWNGSAWSVISSPNPNPSSGLLGVTAISSSDVWAVGFAGSNTLTEHWNGASWSVVTSPSVGQSNELYSVYARSSNDIWAVGQLHRNNGSITQTLVEHWDGASWHIVKSPNIGTDSDFYAVSVVGANDIWAVGDHNGVGALIEHWDGKSWNIVSSPGWGTEDYLYSVSASASNDVWAVGYAVVNTVYKTLVEHWDGNKWSIVADLNPGQSNNMLAAVTVISANNVWAAGSYKDTHRLYDKITFVEQWDGMHWRFVKSPNPGSFNYTLYAMAQVSHSRSIWAVGEWQYKYSTFKTLTEVYC